MTHYTSYALRIDQGANGHGLLSYVNTTASNKLVFSAVSNAAGGLNVMGDGNVGIGTSTPGAMLDVNGTAHFSGVITGTANFAGAVTGSTFKGGINLATTYLTPQTTFRSGSVALYVIPASDSMLVARTDTFDSTYFSIRPLMPLAAGNPGHMLVCERKGTTLPFVLELRSGDLVNGSSTWPSVNNTLVLVSDGINNWIVIANF